MEHRDERTYVLDGAPVSGKCLVAPSALAVPIDPGRDARGRSRDVAGPLYCVAVGAALITLLAVQWSSGWLLLLDWAPGPEGAAGALGLPSGPAIRLVADVAGALSPGLAGWGVVAGGVLLAYAGGVRLARCWRGTSGAPISWWAASVAGLLAAANPYVAARVYSGQVSMIWGSAVMWFLAASLMEADRRGSRRSELRPVLWCALGAAFSLHLLVVGLAMGAVAAVVRSRRSGPRTSVRRLVRFAAGSSAVTLVWLVPELIRVHDTLGGAGGATGAQVFVSGGPLWTLWARAAGGAAFWRELPAGSLTAFGIATGLAWVATLIYAWRFGAGWSRRIRHFLLGCAAVGVVAAHTGRGPTAELWSWSITAVPAVGLLREPGKLAVLATLAPACGAAAAAQRVIDRPHRRRSLPAGMRSALVLGPLTVLLLGSWFAFAGSIPTSSYPAAWYEAREAATVDDCRVAVIGDGAYTDPGFTGGRIVAHPASGFLGERSVISTDPRLPGLEPPPADTDAQRWLDRVNGVHLDDGRFTGTTSSAADAGVGWVFVDRPVDRPELAAALDGAGFEMHVLDDWAGLWRVPGGCA